MPAPEVELPAEVPPDLAVGLARIRADQQVPAAFGPEVLAEAERSATAPRLPERDRTDLELVTLDRPGARDLDQALHLARDGTGYIVCYAIADVAAFVAPGGAVDAEAHRRGLTRHAPDRRTPLYPELLSEEAASLRPGAVRPALLWTLRLDAHGRMTDAEVVRALVRSREQLDYAAAQTEIDGGSARESLALLQEVGEWREQRERDRGGVSLQIPEQVVVPDDGGGWRLEFRAPLPVAGWNAQIALLTGMAAAHLMIYGQVGIVRTMPPADPGAVRRLRQTAKALHIAWPAELDYPELVRALDPRQPRHAAMLNACTLLFRGAGYQSFRGGIPADAEHAALAIDYAHCTAPLRRLVDRYAGEICLALCAGTPVPGWVLRALDALPAEMADAERSARCYERSVLDLVEAWLLAARVGEVFTGTIVEVEESRRHGTVVVADPAVEAKVSGLDLPLGHEVAVRLVGADLDRGAVSFELVSAPTPRSGRPGPG